MRKKLKSMVFLGAVLLLLIGGPALFAQAPATITDISGKVEVRLSGSSAWQVAEEGMELPLKASISTGFRSSAVLEVGGAVLEVSPLSRMRLDELVEREGLVKTELFLQVGRVRADVKPEVGLQKEFRLRSPVTTAAVRGTSFDFDGEVLKVHSGVVTFSNNFNQSTDVGEGEESSSDGQSAPSSGADDQEADYIVQTTTNPSEDDGDNQPPAPKPAGVLIISWGR